MLRMEAAQHILPGDGERRERGDGCEPDIITGVIIIRKDVMISAIRMVDTPLSQWFNR